MQQILIYFHFNQSHFSNKVFLIIYLIKITTIIKFLMVEQDYVLIILR